MVRCGFCFFCWLPALLALRVCVCVCVCGWFLPSFSLLLCRFAAFLTCFCFLLLAFVCIPFHFVPFRFTFFCGLLLLPLYCRCHSRVRLLRCLVFAFFLWYAVQCCGALWCVVLWYGLPAFVSAHPPSLPDHLPYTQPRTHTHTHTHTHRVYIYHIHTVTQTKAQTQTHTTADALHIKDTCAYAYSRAHIIRIYLYVRLIDRFSVFLSKCFKRVLNYY